MILRELHCHTTFCDGKNTPEEMVQAAIKKGLDTIGFSAHSYTFFDDDYCLLPENTLAYQTEIARLKGLYGDKIRILCGIEQDYYSDTPTEGYDFVIGSVHYIKVGYVYLPIDNQPFAQNVQTYLGGDYYALAEAYFANVADVAAKTGCHIIGHFDLLTKFNEGGKLFDESHPRYVAAWKKAVDALLPYGIPFEINTGAMARGYRTAPYPAEAILNYIKQKGGRLILAGDAHSRDGLCYRFEDYINLL